METKTVKMEVTRPSGKDSILPVITQGLCCLDLHPEDGGRVAILRQYTVSWPKDHDLNLHLRENLKSPQEVRLQKTTVQDFSE
jgi:hypothetical protein